MTEEIGKEVALTLVFDAGTSGSQVLVDECEFLKFRLHPFRKLRLLNCPFLRTMKEVIPISGKSRCINNWSVTWCKN